MRSCPCLQPLPRLSCPAGGVTYKTNNFLDKNRDFVVAEHQVLLGASAHDFVRLLFPAEAQAAGGPGGGRAMQSSYKFSSVGSRFKKQVRCGAGVPGWGTQAGLVGWQACTMLPG